MFRYFVIFFSVVGATAGAQDYSTSSIFAHNDYVHPIPFLSSYYEQVGFMEADVFLQQGELMVAHTREEIENEKTLDELYLKPLVKKVNLHQGAVYPKPEKSLTLMIDLKTEGKSTLNLLIQKLKAYPDLIRSPAVSIVVSGNVPDTSVWEKYPSYILFDGRPGIQYSKDHLKRIAFISTAFSAYSQWNGKGMLPVQERMKITRLINEVHASGKRIRFWGAPDFPNAWLAFMNLGVDILGTDEVAGLASFIRSKQKNSFQNELPHAVYVPKDNFPKNAIPKNIILMIGDGMGLTQLYSAYTANRGQLHIFKMKNTGFSITTPADGYITDSAAGATAMATGSKTRNRFVGVDSSGNVLPSLAEKLKRQNFNVAIISAGDITDATPAAFYAHQSERGLNEAIAEDFLNSKVDVLIGGGSYAFRNRKDGKNLVPLLMQRGYTFSDSFKAIDTIRSKKYVILDDKMVVSKKNGREDFLTKSITRSVHAFTNPAKPFFIMAEGAQIDHGGHSNDLEYVVRETLDFDEAVGAVLEFIDNNRETLLIVTADHETGGLTLLGGDITTGSVFGNFSTNDHTAVMVPVFSYGPGAENFRGVYQNTELYLKIASLLKLDR